MRKTGLFIVIFTTLLIFTSCTSITSKQPTNAKDFIKSLDRSLPGLMTKYGVPGASIAILHNGEVIFEKGYGWANKEKKMPVTTKTVFRIASISKTIAAWGVMKLVEDGRLELDAPAERYLKGWHLPPSSFDNNGVTIRRLLSHTAGLTVEGTPLYNADKPLPTLEQSLSGIAGEEWKVYVKYKPGSVFSYSSGGYSVLQQVIEDVTNEEFSDYIEKEVLKPLGMNNTGYDKNIWEKDIMATGYTGSGAPLADKVRVSLAGGSLMATADDLARFTLACMKDSSGNEAGGGVLKPETLKLMFVPVENAKSIMGNYGLGFVNQTLSNKKTMISHSGDILGWNAQMAFIPGNGDGFVLLTNGDGGYYFKSEVLGVWSMWAAGGINNDTGFVLKMQRLLTYIALFFCIILLLMVSRNILQIKNNARVLNFALKIKKPMTWLKVIAVFFGVALWLFLCYSEIPFKLLFKLDGYLLYTFFTPGFSWITLIVVVWGVYFISQAIFTDKIKNIGGKSNGHIENS